MSSIDETKKVAAVVAKEINQDTLCFLVRKQNIDAIIGIITCKIGNCIKLLFVKALVYIILFVLIPLCYLKFVMQ